MNGIAERIAITAAQALAGAILISMNLRWVTLSRRRFRKLRPAA